jgi:AcrR family transcriptional regulator
MPRPYDPQATRHALMTAASELFALHGYAGTTVEMIAHKAKANRALISYHFGGKRKLYLAIVRDLLSTAVEQIREAAAPELPAEERLRRLVRSFDALFRQRPALPVLLIREAASGGRNLDVKILPHFLAVLALVREILEQGARDGSFRPVDPLATHLTVIGSMVFFYATGEFRQRMLQAHGSQDITPVDFVHQIEELFVRGLAAGPAVSAGTAPA